MQSIYNLPKNPRSMGGLQWQALFIGLTVLFLTNIVATQYLAHGFGYQKALGTPLGTVGGHGVYAPYQWIIWFLKFNRVVIGEARETLYAGLTIVASGAGVSVLAAALVMFLRNKNLQSGAEHLHGSARWAARKDIEEAGLLGKGEGVYIGGWQNKKTKQIHYLRHNGPEHILAFAPTRSGKGVGLVLPTLLSWPSSCIVYDIKGENYALTSGWRKQGAANRILKFSPVEIGEGVQFNPLSEIRVGTPRDVSDAQNIAHMLTHPRGDGDDEDHWVESATSLLTGVILYACYKALHEGRVASLPEVAQVLTQPGQGFKETLTEMLNTPLDDGYRFGWLTLNGRRTAVHPVVAEKAQEMMDKEDKELSGILSSAKVKLSLYSDPIVSSNIRRSDFRVDDLVNGDSPASLYVVVPPSDKDRLKPLTRLIFSLIVNRLTETMKFEEGRSVQTNKHRLLLLIDEFPTLGRMDSIVNAMGYTAGYGIKYYLIVQDKVQLNNVYGDNELVFSGTHLRIAYAPNNPETAELLSRMTGTMTVQKQAFSYSGNRLSPMLGQMSTNVEQVERPLMTPDECGRLPGPKKDAQGNITEAGDMLIFATGFPPIYGKQILYFKDEVFAARARIAAVQKNGGGAPALSNTQVSATGPESCAEEPHESEDEPVYPEATPDVAAEDESAVLRQRQHDIEQATDEALYFVSPENNQEDTTTTPDEPKDNHNDTTSTEGRRSVHRRNEPKTPEPAPATVRRVVIDQATPDLFDESVEVARVKPPKH